MSNLTHKHTVANPSPKTWASGLIPGFSLNPAYATEYGTAKYSVQAISSMLLNSIVVIVGAVRRSYHLRELCTEFCCILMHAAVHYDTPLNTN